MKNSLCCDDSFRFCKACQVLADYFDCDAMFPTLVTVDYTVLNDSITDGEGKDTNKEESPSASPSPSPPLSPTARRHRVAATLACLAAALPLYTRSLWAKQPLDKLFATVAQRRLQLDPDQREQLDELTTKITLARRKAISGKPAQTVRVFNSTAHPLKTKKVGLLR